MSGKTLNDKIWDAHVAHEADDGTCLLSIDRHLVHEVTSPHAFEGLRMAGRAVHAPDKTLAVPDHNVPTTLDRAKGIENEESRIQVEALDKNARDRFRDHEHYAACVEFCERWDQPSFDPDYDTYSLAHFEPLVRALFAREPRPHF